MKPSASPMPCPRAGRAGPWLLAATALIAALGLPRLAWADLMLYPTRVVFDRNQRAAQVELINNGKESSTYRITLVNRRMSEIGEFTAAEPPLPDERFAVDLLRYSPRQVVVAPGTAQTVRLLLRKPADLPPGEYRSHLQFDLVPEALGAANLETLATPLPAGQVGVQLRPMVGIAIPIIVRHGATAAQVRLSQLRLEPAGPEPVLAAVIERSGNRSVFGDLVASFTDASGTREIGRAAGVAVYVPNPLRRIRMTLPPAASQLGAGQLRLLYVERQEDGGKPLADLSVKLP